MPKFIVPLLFTLLLSPVAAVAQSPDTVEVEPLFEARDLLFAGGFALGTVAMVPLDLAIAEELQDSTRQANDYLKGAAATVRFLGHPGALWISGGMYMAGVASDYRPLADIGLHATESILLAEAFTVTIKGLAGRARPYIDTEESLNFELGRGFGNDDFRSFPSGHATAPFGPAAAITTEMEHWVPGSKPIAGTVLFGGATLVAVSRGYHNEHWASDVVAGAAIGSFAGWKVVRYHHTHPHNVIDRWLLPSVAPAPTGELLVIWTIPLSQS